MSDELFTIKVNGREVKTNENKKLIRLLRDDLGCTSVKDGCSEGACGTCTVLMDGRPVRACIMTTKQAPTNETPTSFSLRRATMAVEGGWLCSSMVSRD